jgi:hypothetical protein
LLDVILETAPLGRVLELEEPLFLVLKGPFSTDELLVRLVTLGEQISEGAGLMQVILEMLRERGLVHVSQLLNVDTR